MIQIGAIASEQTNLTTRSLEEIEAASRDPYARGIKDADTVQTAEMSFDDVIDMLNPLEHIPGVSALYRAAEDESIHPVSRIVGDMLYGGIFGLASVGLSAASAIGDEILTAANDGQSTTATVLALFSDDTPPSTRLAQNTKPPPATSASLSGELLQTALAEQEIGTKGNASLGLLARSMAEEKAKMPSGGILDSSLASSGSGASGGSSLPMAVVLQGKEEIVAAQNALQGSNTRVLASTKPEMALSLRDKLKNEAAAQNLLAEIQQGKTLNQYRATALASPHGTFIKAID